MIPNIAPENQLDLLKGEGVNEKGEKDITPSSSETRHGSVLAPESDGNAARFLESC